MQRISAEGGKVARKLGQHSILAWPRHPPTGSHPPAPVANTWINTSPGIFRLITSWVRRSTMRNHLGQTYVNTRADLEIVEFAQKCHSAAHCAELRQMLFPARLNLWLVCNQPSFKKKRGWRERRRVRMWLMEEAGEEWLQTSCLDTSCRITSSSSEVFFVCFVFRTTATHISIVTNQDERCQSHITPSSQV